MTTWRGEGGGGKQPRGEVKGGGVNDHVER